MTSRPKSPRERAARALCNLEGHPPDVMFDGGPMWVSYLPTVDAVLRIVLGDKAWAAMVEAEKAGNIASRPS